MFGQRVDSTTTQEDTMTELQATIFGDHVPTRAHPEDTVTCSDDTECLHRDALVDCRGGFHSDDEDRHEANVTIVTDVLDGVGSWSDEYHTENTDYANDYSHIVTEMSHNWPQYVEEWIENEYYGEDDFDDCMGEAVQYVCDNVTDWEAEYDRADYACYSGDGCCLWSLDIGECEEQVEVSAFEELQALHDAGELDDVLDDVSCDVCVSRGRRREKNEKTGYYENVGRETYMPYDRDSTCPCLLIYTMPGGQWHYVVSADDMRGMVQSFLDGRAEDAAAALADSLKPGETIIWTNPENGKDHEIDIAKVTVANDGVIIVDTDGKTWRCDHGELSEY